MGIMGGARGQKVYVGEYDFARDGGAQSTIVLRSESARCPPGPS